MFNQQKLFGSTKRSLRLDTRKGVEIKNQIEPPPDDRLLDREQRLLKQFGYNWRQRVGYVLPSKAMRKALLQMPECEEFRELYWRGSLTEVTLRRYIQELMTHLKIGERFPYDFALALIAVGLEPFSDPFAEEYLSDLSGLELAELPMSIGVAKACLAERNRLADNISRQFLASDITESNTFQEMSSLPEQATSSYETIEAA